MVQPGQESREYSQATLVGFKPVIGHWEPHMTTLTGSIIFLRNFPGIL